MYCKSRIGYLTNESSSKLIIKCLTNQVNKKLDILQVKDKVIEKQYLTLGSLNRSNIKY